MDVQENCIQLKIDNIISDINQNSQDNQNEEKNQITALMGYSHCLDLFDFLQIFSKIQKNELLFQTAIIYDSIGYNELSMDYINESLLLIPNVPSIILYKSGLFASLNKLDEAQKWLLKYKYLIGENKYDNYIHDSILVIFYYLLEYEEYIILRKISSIENNFPNYINENVVLLFIKSKTLEKLAQKFKSADKKRYISYIKESEEIKNKYISNKKNESEFLLEQGIRNENVTKLLILINPNLLKYKPKKLIEYKKGFNKNGFSLFFTLIKINKILKLEIETKKYKKVLLNKKTKNNGSNKNTEKKLNTLNEFLKIIQDNNFNSSMSEDQDIQTCQETIKKLCNSIWIMGYINNKNKEKKNKENRKIITNKNVTNLIKANYYINEGYYSHLNLKKSILKNIEYNNNYKNNKLKLDSFLDDINNDEIKIVLDNKNSKSNVINKTNTLYKNKNNSNTVLIKNRKKQIKKIDMNKNKTKRIKNSLSDIIKKVITAHPKENNKNKRNKNKNYNNENKDSKKSKKFCSTDNCNNKILSQTINKKKNELMKIESNSLLSKKKEEELINKKEENKDNKDNKIKNEKDKEKDKDKDKDKQNEENKIKEVNNNKIENEKNSTNIEKNDNSNKENKIEKKNTEKSKELTNGDKNKLLTTNSSKKKVSLINSNEQVKPMNKNIHNNQVCTLREKKMDTDYGKYKDVKEINLVSYCLKQLMKKKENKNKNVKQKEIVNLTDKIDLMIPQKIIDLEKQILQINEHKYLKSKSKKKKLLNKSIKKQINTFTFEKKMKKNTQKNSDNNLINSNKSTYTNGINFNNNMKNLKKTINNYGNKKELSKFKSLNYLHGNFYSNNNYLNINFNNYMNYNFNYSNRHDDKKNFDFRFNPNSDNKKREESYSKEKFNFRTINLDFKNMSTKLNNYNKKPLLNSFIDSKEKNKKSSDNKHDFAMMPFNKIKNSPSGEMTCLKRKLKNFKSNLIKQKTKTSFSKYMLYNMGKKNDAFYFSKSINTSEYNKYKNSSTNKSKNIKNRYNKTITNKSNSKLNNK